MTIDGMKVCETTRNCFANGRKVSITQPLRTLFVAHELEMPPKFGGQIRQWNILRALKECGEVDVVTFLPQESEPASALISECRNVFRVPRHVLKLTEKHQSLYESSVGRLYLTLSSVRPYQYLGQSQSGLAEWFRKLVAENRYDAIWVSKACLAIALGWRDSTRTILDGDDYEYVREYMLLRNEPWYGAKVSNYLNVVKLALWERTLPRWFARVTRCSEADRRRTRAGNVVVIPNGAEFPGTPARRNPERRALFVGDLGYPPNTQGITWFLENVWPQVRRYCPTAQLDIVGRLPPEAALRRDGSEGIRVHGFVEDLTPFWERAGVSVVPLLSGAGTRLKILDSLSHAVPVVTTGVGAYGLDLGESEGVFVQDSTTDFSARVVELLCEPARGMSLALGGRESVAARYNWADIRERIQDLTREVAGHHDH